MKKGMDESKGEWERETERRETRLKRRDREVYGKLCVS